VRWRGTSKAFAGLHGGRKVEGVLVGGNTAHNNNNNNMLRHDELQSESVGDVAREKERRRGQ
jgi:hypothetical protein